MRRTVGLALALALAASACRQREQPLTPNLAKENKVAVRTVTLYFEAPTMMLVPERRDVALPENRAGALAIVVRELFKGSANSAVPRLFPEDTVVRGAFLLNDTAFVDLGGPTLSQGWGVGTHQELMAVYSLVETVTANFAEAKRVRVLIDGVPAETLAGHISLAKSLTPMPTLVDGVRAP